MPGFLFYDSFGFKEFEFGILTSAVIIPYFAIAPNYSVARYCRVKVLAHDGAHGTGGLGVASFDGDFFVS